MVYMRQSYVFINGVGTGIEVSNHECDRNECGEGESMASSKQVDESFLSDAQVLPDDEVNEYRYSQQSLEPGANSSRPRVGILGLSAIGLFAVGAFTGAGLFGSHSAHAPISSTAVATEAYRPPEIVVDVHGDVVHPGVYHLPVSARVADAVRAAGGFEHASDATVINSAALLDDGSEIEIPAPAVVSGDHAGGGPNDRLESNFAAVPGNAQGIAGSAPIDLNTATLATLETLPGIGESRADAIVAYRRLHGPFPSVSDLSKVHGIGKSIVSHIQPYLFVARRTGTNH
jgi:competence ComEA-like helix-hairpin-helix protein